MRDQCGFRKGLNTQNAPLSMAENLLLARDKREVSGEILTDLSRAFHYIGHDLFIPKLYKLMGSTKMH